MFSPPKSTVREDAPCKSSDASCACPPINSKISQSTKPSGWLRDNFKKCAQCACSGAGGMLAGHIGCVISPLVVVAAGVTTATASVSVLAVAFSTAATAGGLYLWHKLRGQQSGKLEKRIVIGSAVTGLLVSSAMNLANGHHHHHHPQNADSPAGMSEPYCGQNRKAVSAQSSPITKPVPQQEHSHLS